MAYELDQFISDCRSILARDPGPDGPRRGSRSKLERLSAKSGLRSRALRRRRRAACTSLYEDPELGFQVLAHINDKARVSPPHDHGASWAIYGQATHYTDMIEWEREDNGGDPKHAKLKPVKKYRLDAGPRRHLSGRQDPLDRLSGQCPLRPRDRDQSRQDQSRALRPQDRRSASDDAAAGDVIGRRLEHACAGVASSRRACAAMLADGGELALVDVREELIFSQSHLLLARSVPLSRLELRFAQLVPRRGTRIVLCDDDDGLAERAAAILARNGYTDVAILDGGVAAWAAAGFELFSGVNVPSKAFGEFIEHESDTPSISAGELEQLIRERRRHGGARQPAVRRILARVDPDRDQCAGRRTGVARPRDRAVAGDDWWWSIAPAARAASSARSR